MAYHPKSIYLNNLTSDLQNSLNNPYQVTTPGTSALIVSDTFPGSTINTTKWNYGGNSVVQTNGNLRISCSVSDQVGWAFLKFSEILSNVRVVIRYYLHDATTSNQNFQPFLFLVNSPYYGPRFTFSLNAVGIQPSTIRYVPDGVKTNVQIQASGGPNVLDANTLSSTLYEKWITTTLEYNASTKTLKVDYTSDGIWDYTHVTNNTFNPAGLYLHAYGWFTGSYMDVSSVSVYKLTDPTTSNTHNLVFGDVGTNLYRLYDPTLKKLTTPTQPPFTVSSGQHIVKTSIGLFAWSQGGRYVSLSTNNGVTWNTATDYGSDLTSYALKVIVVLKNGVETMLLGSADYDLNGTLAWATIATTPVITTFANPLGGTKACPFRGHDGTPLLVIDGVGGSIGLIAKYNGTTWDQSIAEPTGTVSSCIHVVKTQNNNYIATGITYSGGQQGFIRRSTNFTTWSNRIDIIGLGNSAGLYITPTGRIFNSTFSGVTSTKLRYSDDEGLTWNSATFPATACDGSNAFCVPIYDSVTSKLYIASTSEYILSSVDDGTNWTTETSLSGVTIDAFSSNFLFNLPNALDSLDSIDLTKYTLLTTTAAISADLQNQIQNKTQNVVGNTTWNVINTPVQQQNMQNNSGYIHNTSTENFFKAPSSPQIGNTNYLVDNNAGGWAFQLNDNQSLQIGNFSITGAWNSWNNPTPNNTFSVSSGFFTSKTGLVIGYDGYTSGIVKSTDSINWSVINIGIGGLNSIVGSESADKLIGINQFGVFTSNTSGSSWIQQSSLLNLVEVACSSGGDIVIGRRLLSGFQTDSWWLSTNGGVTFNAKSPYNRYRGLDISKNGNNIVLCTNSDDITGGYILTSSDMGENFTQKGPPKNWRSLAISSDANRIVAITLNQNDYIYISDDNGNTWNTTGYTKTWTEVKCSDDGNTIVALTGATTDISGNIISNTEVYVSQNFGSTWQKLKIRNTYITTIGLTDDGKTIYVCPYRAAYSHYPIYVSSQNTPTTQNISVLTKNDPYWLTGLSNSYADIVWIDSTHAILEDHGNVIVS